MVYFRKKSLSSHLKYIRRTPKLATVNKGRAIMRRAVAAALRRKLGSDVTGIILQLAGSPSMSTPKYKAWVKLHHALSARKVYKKK